MSGKSCTSGSMRSCAGSVRLGTSSGHEVVLDALYERKRDKKSVRVLTVLVYVFCVSLAAIMLSLYYVFFWEPKDAQYAQRKVSQTVKQQSTTPMPTCFMLHTGGSSTTINDSDLQLPPSSVTYPDEHEASETIETTVTEPTTQFNSTLHYNETTEAIIDTKENETTTLI
ncbi:uncharacterized protein inaF-D isoform X1 [Epargyreus clarus]|uniref:uncharacterized protein inaF-D isoform X1 n=1 Tax=Epargyreus clarus TaxID=520877 RepID=UPI003C2E3D74